MLNELDQFSIRFNFNQNELIGELAGAPDSLSIRDFSIELSTTLRKVYWSVSYLRRGIG